jgi:aldose 1-epimerase
MAAEPMPVAIGFHPCYWVTDAPRADWVVTMPAKTWWPLTPTKVPTGATEPIDKIFPNGQGRLADYNLDDVFDNLKRDAQGRAHVSVKGKQQQIEVTMDEAFKALVIFSPNPTNKGLGSQANGPNGPAAPTAAAPAANAAPPAPRQESVCFEPMAGITDGMNLAHRGLYKDQQFIPPNQTWEANFWVKPTGF